jgi:hypothetical protein
MNNFVGHMSLFTIVCVFAFYILFWGGLGYFGAKSKGLNKLYWVLGCIILPAIGIIVLLLKKQDPINKPEKSPFKDVALWLMGQALIISSFVSYTLGANSMVSNYIPPTSLSALQLVTPDSAANGTLQAPYTTQPADSPNKLYTPTYAMETWRVPAIPGETLVANDKTSTPEIAALVELEAHTLQFPARFNVEKISTSEDCKEKGGTWEGEPGKCWIKSQYYWDIYSRTGDRTIDTPPGEYRVVNRGLLPDPSGNKDQFRFIVWGSVQQPPTKIYVISWYMAKISPYNVNLILYLNPVMP